LNLEQKYYIATVVLFVVIVAVLYLVAVVVQYFKPVYMLSDVVFIVSVGMILGAVYMESVKRIRERFVNGYTKKR
jgi:glucose uptake protein GlcU